MEGWIKIHRRIVEWEWFDDDATFKVFIWLLVNANHEAKNWHGITIERGQLVTSLDSISRSTKHSVQSVRTILNRLKSTNEITSESTNKFTIITIKNYDSYQSQNEDDQQAKQQADQQTNNNQPTSNQHSINIQSTTNKNVKNDKNDKNEKNDKNSVVRFTPPTIEEVISYCQERRNNVDATRFINFYEMKGWMVGKNKMKDWKAAVRTWEGIKTVSKPTTLDNRFVKNIWNQ